MRWTCWVLGVLAWSTQCTLSRFVFDTEKAVKIPLQVNIGLIGFAGDGGFGANVQQYELQALLESVLPTHRPSCITTQEPLAVEYDIEYRVAPLPGVIEHVEAALKKQLAIAGLKPGKQNQVIDVEARTIEPDMERMHQRAMDMAHGMFSRERVYTDYAPTIYIINPRKEELLAKDSEDENEAFQYRYMYAGAGASQIWLSKHNFVVADVSAGPVSLGATNDPEGSLSVASLPRSAELENGSKGEFVAKLVNLCKRAVQQVFAPDVQHPTHEPAEKIYIPLLVFRNHRQFDPLSEKAAQKLRIDLKQIEEQVGNMVLPNQKAHVMADTLNVGDHVHVSMALARAMRDNTVIQAVPGNSKFLGSKDSHYEMRSRRYLDSAVLRNEFNKSAHMLDSVGPEMSMLRKRKELWQFFHPMVPPSLDRSDLHGHPRLQLSQGVRVLPVYVFSLMGLEHELLVDQNSLFSATPDTVFALQTETSTVQAPYFIDGTRVGRFPQDSTTQQIVAGLMSALGGLVPPVTRWSPLHQRQVQDWAWAVGAQPWAPFSNAPVVSQLGSSLVLRNFLLTNLHGAQHIVWRVLKKLDQFTRKYLYDPFAEVSADQVGYFSLSDDSNTESPFPVHTVDALNAEMGRLQGNLDKVSVLMGKHQYKEAYAPASILVERATAFEKYAEEELEAAEIALSCCSVEHSTMKTVDLEVLVYIGGSAVLVFACVALTFRVGSKPKRRFA